MKKLMQLFFLLSGLLLVGLGILGIILPILPTTPFLLLATFCFAKSSSTFHQWFTKTNLYLHYVQPALTDKAMEKKQKKKAMVTLSIVFTISFFLVPIWHAKLAILIVALLHLYYFLFKVKTVSQSKENTYVS